MAPYWAAETHYKSTGAPHNKAGFWTRSQRLTVAKPPRGLGAPPRQFARGRPTKPRMGDYVVCALRCDFAAGGDVSWMNKQGATQQAWGEKPHSEPQAWLRQLEDGDEVLGVAKMWKCSCCVCVRTAQAWSRALCRPVVTASRGDRAAPSYVHAFDATGLHAAVLNPSPSVVAAVRSMRASAIRDVLSNDAAAAALYARRGGADRLPLGCARDLPAAPRSELLYLLHFGVLVAEYAAAAQRGGVRSVDAVVVAHRSLLASKVGLAAATQLTTPLVDAGEWDAFARGGVAALPPIPRETPKKRPREPREVVEISDSEEEPEVIEIE
mmetsp:Transcript_1718/g.5070  ORF Transcript_1718/g.5070 Transcript_1718/m.5070 type:complete len:325 (+) Transcript_1718:294-1268(+)